MRTPADFQPPRRLHRHALGFGDETARKAARAALIAFWRRGGCPRCGAPRVSDGRPCGWSVRAAGLRCWLHGSTKAGRARRARRLDPAQSSPEQIGRAVRRAVLNRLARTWRKEPWTPGLTLDLGEHEAAFRDALAAAGWPIARVPYGVADWARWKWRRAFRDGQHLPDLWREAAAALPARIAKAGPPPEGWAWVEPAAPAGLAYTLPARLAPDSKRRRPDPPRVPRRPAPAGRTTEADTLRALAVLREHGEALAPALAVARTEDARLRLALAFARLQAGEISHLDWIDALAAAKAGG